MEASILQSVIELTQQSDIDSLEVSLISSLAELVPASAIFLVKQSDETPGDKEVIRLGINDGTGSEHKYKWSHDFNHCNEYAGLEECFNKITPVQITMEDGSTRYFFPVIQNSRTAQVLGLETRQGLAPW